MVGGTELGRIRRRYHSELSKTGSLNGKPDPDRIPTVSRPYPIQKVCSACSSRKRNKISKNIKKFYKKRKKLEHLKSWHLKIFEIEKFSISIFDQDRLGKNPFFFPPRIASSPWSSPASDPGSRFIMFWGFIKDIVLDCRLCYSYQDN